MLSSLSHTYALPLVYLFPFHLASAQPPRFLHQTRGQPYINKYIYIYIYVFPQIFQEKEEINWSLLLSEGRLLPVLA